MTLAMWRPNCSRKRIRASSTAASEVKSASKIGESVSRRAVQTDDPVVAAERGRQRPAEIAPRAGNQDDRSSVAAHLLY